MAAYILDRRRLECRLDSYLPFASCDTMSILGTGLAEAGNRVLHISPVTPHLRLQPMVASVQDAISSKRESSRSICWTTAASELCKKVIVDAGINRDSTPRPFLIVNDINYFFGDPTTGALSGDQLSVAHNELLKAERILHSHGGECIVAATEDPTDNPNGMLSQWFHDHGWRRFEFASSLKMVSHQTVLKKASKRATHELPPPQFPYGPLEGTQKEVASWLHPHRKPDRRVLDNMTKNGLIRIKRIHKRLIEVYFDTELRFARANKRRLEDEAVARQQSATAR